jgi:hypothetical protein
MFEYLIFVPVFCLALIAASSWLFGRDVVMRQLALLYAALVPAVSAVSRRLLAAARVLIGVEIDADAVKDDIVDAVEERLSYRIGNDVNMLNNKLYHVEQRIMKKLDEAGVLAGLKNDQS